MFIILGTHYGYAVCCIYVANLIMIMYNYSLSSKPLYYLTDERIYIYSIVHTPQMLWRDSQLSLMMTMTRRTDDCFVILDKMQFAGTEMS